MILYFQIYKIIRNMCDWCIVTHKIVEKTLPCKVQPKSFTAEEFKTLCVTLLVSCLQEGQMKGGHPCDRRYRRFEDRLQKAGWTHLINIKIYKQSR